MTIYIYIYLFVLRAFSHRRSFNLLTHEAGFCYELCYRNRTDVLIRATRRHLPEDDNHHSHRRGNLKSYVQM
jgi:hypothetical protein